MTAENPERSHDEYTKLSTKVKRGTGTRDQDTTKITTRHPDPQEAVQRHAKALAALDSLSDTARGTQPGENE